MNTFLWVLQILLAIIFFFVSGIIKATLPEEKLLRIGQTGVMGLSPALIKFIGVIEMLGAIAMILPIYFNILPILTPIAALGFAIIMVIAARIHHRLKEPRNVATNIIILCMCLVVAIGRI